MTSSALGHPLDELRQERRALRAEQARVGRWRRVVRARMDLVVASAARPEDLGAGMASVLPVDVVLEAPPPAALAGALEGTAAVREVGVLPALRDLDARLARYEDGVEQALHRVTDRLVERLARDPGAVAGLLARTTGRG
ncbi:hypothetical protein [Cellulomonas shaoxiangyii]|uniref:RsiG-like domain-containing protein n=1 Tax=Cellulomonas shaoxiangyii TaxID=2566013 RepID=A0A4P7SEM9_9CELL|nr:hypothetical protein [Cellulomonas shaoxiangyii]QCB92492.1 hypothetical protein E5225_01900 [Cellulomonas shaoxiangyii]TGY84956.1 hypothetical protein E5226_08750 [Cellulomonas shaoxiangyii]